MPEADVSVPFPFPVRRVVTGHRDGVPVVVADGAPPVTVASPTGHGLSELLWLNGPPTTADDGGDPDPALRGSFPAKGAIVGRLIRFPAAAPGTPVDATWLRVPGDDPDQPGMHRTETLDFMVVLDGHIVLGLDDGEHQLGPGDAVVQRGTRHRWRVTGEHPCTFLSVLLSPDPEATVPDTPATKPQTPHPDSSGLQLLITETHSDDPSDGHSFAAVAAAAPPAFPPGEVAIYDLWQTGGPLAHPAQGFTGVPATAPWTLEPLGHGAAFRRVDMAAGHDPGTAGWHTTDTVDIGVVVSGSLELSLAAEDSDETSTVVLHTGDAVIQRGTRHRWRPAGNVPAVLASVMLAVTDK
ncbi:cupin domain-containing protein [Yinghuangia sp. YIM S09857]|uniref:cupin domain-containing protein n=1 Tax=Yinghuangia sp. YIM S09857 TaxID=3436929 RepID=UPI003F53733E